MERGRDRNYFGPGAVPEITDFGPGARAGNYLLTYRAWGGARNYLLTYLRGLGRGNNNYLLGPSRKLLTAGTRAGQKLLTYLPGLGRGRKLLTSGLGRGRKKT